MNTPTPGDLSARHAATLQTMIHQSDDGAICICAECRALKAAIAALSALPAAGGGDGKLAEWARRINEAAKGIPTDGLSTLASDGRPLHEAKATIIGASALILERLATTPQPSAAEGLIAAAEAYASNYNDDDRQDIKADVMNAFFAGSQYKDAAVGAQGDAAAWMEPKSIKHLAKQNGVAKVDAWNCASGSDRVPLYTHPAPAAGKGVEAHARELLAIEYERGGMLEIATVIRHGNIPTGWKDDCLALKAISAALTRQPVVGALVGSERVHVICVCPDCVTRQPVAGDGWRVLRFSGTFKRHKERWEVYDPEGSGGAVDEDDVKDLVVRDLLDALATAMDAAPEAMPTDQSR